MAARLLLFVKFQPLVDHGESISAAEFLFRVHARKSLLLAVTHAIPEDVANMTLFSPSQSHFWESLSRSGLLFLFYKLHSLFYLPASLRALLNTQEQGSSLRLVCRP